MHAERGGRFLDLCTILRAVLVMNSFVFIVTEHYVYLVTSYDQALIATLVLQYRTYNGTENGSMQACSYTSLKAYRHVERPSLLQAIDRP